MKKLILASVLAAALANVTAFGQGQLIFGVSGAVNSIKADSAAAAKLGIATGANIPGAGRFTADLYYAPLTAGNPPADTALVGGQMGAAYSIVAPGTIAGGTRTTPATTAGGADAWFQVRVWETTFGSFDAAVAGGGAYGKSSVFRFTTSAPPTGVPQTINGVVSPFVVTVVPEPSTLAFGALGLLGFFLLRRRS